VEQRLDVRAFAGRDDDGVDLGPRDDRRVVARMKLRAGLLREITRLGRLRIGNRQEPDGGMLRRQARAQRADAARANDGDAQFLALDGDFLPRAILSGACARRATARSADWVGKKPYREEINSKVKSNPEPAKKRAKIAYRIHARSYLRRNRGFSYWQFASPRRVQFPPLAQSLAG
jgi:hypothetical protein